MKPTVWIHPGAVAIYGTSFDAAPHSHHAMQVVWCSDNSSCKLNGLDFSGAIVINSQIVHQLEMSKGWVLLIEPRSNLGVELSIKLAEESYQSYKIPNYSGSEPAGKTENIVSLFTPLFNELNLTKHYLITNKSTVKDKRIQQLLSELEHCLKGKCIKPSTWRASEVASQLALSESRFLHLFSQELGIAWRPYLLWRRMICAIQTIINGTSATNAAHLAGFSDSSHLSRTFRNNFGMSIRQASSLFKNLS